MNKSILFSIPFLLLHFELPALADQEQDPAEIPVETKLDYNPLVTANKLDPATLINGEKTIKTALASLEELALASTVRFVRDGETFILGTVVTDDGYVATKASEFEDEKPFQIQLPDGELLNGKIIASDKINDIAIAKIPAARVPPIVWGSTKKAFQGLWVTSPSENAETLKVGVLSANRRAIARRSGVLGVALDNHDGPENLGVGLIGVRPDSPADKVGLKKGDLIMAVNGVKVFKVEDVSKEIDRFDPGDTVELTVERGEETLSLFPSLAHRSLIFDPLDRNQQMSGNTSKRKAGFTDILQSDLPLPPEAMGSAMIDLSGHALGINIARFDRVTTYTLPSELIEQTVADLIPAEEATSSE